MTFRVVDFLVGRFIAAYEKVGAWWEDVHDVWGDDDG